MSSSAPPAPKSAVSVAAVAAAGTNCGSPMPALSRLPRNWTLSAMISTACRFVPSWASHSRQSRRPFTATRSLQTAVPLGVCRSSGSFVRFPTRTTRLMFAMVFLSGSRTSRPSLLRLGVGRVTRTRVRPRDLPHGHVPHDPVRDLEHAGDLVQRLRARVEGEQMVGALALVVDLVGELAAPPDVLVRPGSAASLDELAR